jgi:hypothetical protein
MKEEMEKEKRGKDLGERKKGKYYNGEEKRRKN